MAEVLQNALVIKVVWFNPKLASLPPSSEGFALNVARAHMQVCYMVALIADFSLPMLDLGKHG